MAIFFPKIYPAFLIIVWFFGGSRCDQMRVASIQPERTHLTFSLYKIFHFYPRN